MSKTRLEKLGRSLVGSVAANVEVLVPENELMYVKIGGLGV